MPCPGGFGKHRRLQGAARDIHFFGPETRLNFTLANQSKCNFPHGFQPVRGHGTDREVNDE
jgi:hypothetical protein